MKRILIATLLIGCAAEVEQEPAKQEFALDPSCTRMQEKDDWCDAPAVFYHCDDGSPQMPSTCKVLFEGVKWTPQDDGWVGICC